MRAINNEDDYVKAGNYWRWLKKKFTTNGIQLVSVTHEFKFEAPDGKQRFADARCHQYGIGRVASQRTCKERTKAYWIYSAKRQINRQSPDKGECHSHIDRTVSHTRSSADSCQCSRQYRYCQLDNGFPKIFVFHCFIV